MQYTSGDILIIDSYKPTKQIFTTPRANQLKGETQTIGINNYLLLPLKYHTASHCSSCFLPVKFLEIDRRK
jgi:hypothetical protein